MSIEDELVIFSVMANDFKLFQQRLEKSKDINFQYRGKGSALHQAARSSHFDMVVELIKKGADVNLLHHEYGNTPLDWAQEMGHGEIVKYLKSHGAKYNKRNSDFIADQPSNITTEINERFDDFTYVEPPAVKLSEEYFEISGNYEGLVSLFNNCEIYCVADCCGLNAFSFSRKTIEDNCIGLNVIQIKDELARLKAKVFGSNCDLVSWERLNQNFSRNNFLEFLQHIESRLP